MAPPSMAELGLQAFSRKEAKKSSQKEKSTRV